MKWPNQKAKCLTLIVLCLSAITACQTGKEYPPSAGHIGIEIPQAETPAVIPEVVDKVPYLPKPALQQQKQEKYTVVVNDVPVQELLFALARDAKLNLDVFGDIEGRVSLNAIDQTLPKILERIGKQSQIRYQIADGVLDGSAVA